MKGVQCYELFGGIALKNHTFSFSFSIMKKEKTLSNNMSRIKVHMNGRQRSEFKI